MLHSHLTTLNAVSLVLSTFNAEGLPSEALLAGSGIRAADLSRADTRITTNQEMRVCANAVALRREIGLELGRRMHVSSYGMLGYALLTSATLGDALRLALRYPALLGTLFESEPGGRRRTGLVLRQWLCREPANGGVQYRAVPGLAQGHL